MELEELQEKLHLSAQVGKELLERNTELVRQNEEQLQEFSARSEELEQQNHQLRTEVRLLKIREREAQDELREELERNRQAQDKTDAERLLTARSLDDLKQVIEHLHSQLEQKSLLLEQQSEDYARQAGQVCELQELLSSYSRSDAEADNQLAEMQAALTTEQCQRIELAAHLNDAQNQIQRLELDKSHLTKDISLLKDSSGEQTKQVAQWSQALENSREEIATLRSQLDLLQSARDNNSHAVSGNSIFGELEDERQKYEAEAATLRVKYRSLEKQHASQRQQFRQLKGQLHALFQVSRSRADQDELQRLKRKVAESSSVVQTLRARIAQLEDVQGTNESAEHLRQLRSSFQRTVTEAGDTVTSDLYVEFLQRELELVRLREKETRNELDTSRIQLIAEGDKLHQAESQIHQLEVELSKARSDSVQARLKLDELAQQQRKNQQDQHQKSQSQERQVQTQPQGAQVAALMQAQPQGQPKQSRSRSIGNLTDLHSHPGHVCKGHLCDSMYERPTSPLRQPSSPLPDTITVTPCAARGKGSRRRISSSSPREPLQVLTSMENVPHAKGRSVTIKSPAATQRQKPHRQTVRLASMDASEPGECAQQ
ncbi:protein Spindly-like [Sycon ciliatum]|uniref:protein Spindly-like n=1 Tax=Sycon ciliatum TaxID=27933 RepID=UPI0020A9925B|eukprot:scpid48395/ scgid25782/ Protein Spindly; Coiled-coil domain-containing protein 99